jgi:hypothetical protein
MTPRTAQLSRRYAPLLPSKPMTCMFAVKDLVRHLVVNETQTGKPTRRRLRTDQPTEDQLDGAVIVMRDPR